ncbi:MAG: hypothetical protein IKX90_00810, partial [Verrucomicrobia bacterium]|nr:hypothetical protein [Verrucomicrobiota bacterium]
NKYEYNRSLPDGLRRSAIVPHIYPGLQQLDTSSLLGNLGTFYRFHAHDVSKQHHILPIKYFILRAIQISITRFLMLFHMDIGNTFDLSNTHLPAGLCDRVFCLGILSEKEKEFCSSFFKSSCVSLLLEPVFDFRYCMLFLFNNFMHFLTININ